MDSVSYLNGIQSSSTKSVNYRVSLGSEFSSPNQFHSAKAKPTSETDFTSPISQSSVRERVTTSFYDKDSEGKVKEIIERRAAMSGSPPPFGDMKGEGQLFQTILTMQRKYDNLIANINESVKNLHYDANNNYFKLEQLVAAVDERVQKSTLKLTQLETKLVGLVAAFEGHKQNHINEHSFNDIRITCEGHDKMLSSVTQTLNQFTSKCERLEFVLHDIPTTAALQSMEDGIEQKLQGVHQRLEQHEHSMKEAHNSRHTVNVRIDSKFDELREQLVQFVKTALLHVTDKIETDAKQLTELQGTFTSAHSNMKQEMGLKFKFVESQLEEMQNNFTVINSLHQSYTQIHTEIQQLQNKVQRTFDRQSDCFALCRKHDSDMHSLNERLFAATKFLQPPPEAKHLQIDWHAYEGRKSLYDTEFSSLSEFAPGDILAKTPKAQARVPFHPRERETEDKFIEALKRV